MPTSWEDAQQAMRRWLITTTGLPDERVIFANQNAPRPKVPYATVNARVATRRLGAFDEERLIDDEPGVIDRRGHRVVTASVNVFGPSALDLAEAAQDGLERYDVREQLEAAGLAVNDIGQLRDLTQLVETTLEDRYQFDAIFGIARATKETVGWIESVEIEATYNAGGDPPVTIESTLNIGGA